MDTSPSPTEIPASQRCAQLTELAASRVVAFDYAAAVSHAREAAELARSLGLRREESRALLQLGIALTGTGQFADALDALLRALELHEALAAERPGDSDGEARWERGELFGRIAIVYSNLGQGEQALSYYRVALESFGGAHPLHAARTLYRMGIAATEILGDGTRGEEYYRASLRIYEECGNREGVGLALIGLAGSLLGRGARDEAERTIRQALAALETEPAYVSYYADALWVLSDVLVRGERYADALASLERAHPIFLQTNRPAAHLSELHHRLSNVHAALGGYAEALRHHRRYHELQVEHLQGAADAKMAALMVQFDTAQALKDREIHRLRSIELEREVAERKEAEAALSRAQAELEERNRELHALTIRDPLTGAFNRRYLDQRLAEALPLAVRGIQPLGVMICDLDDFKRINDTFSHAVGDDVLRTVAALLRQHVRQSDVVARFGGEEFVVLFPATTLEQATAASEKVCALVREYGWEGLQAGLRVTISAGVAAATGQPTPEKLLSDADARLYEAKRLGKDRVVG
jgi:diguanylate cyclase (GGDEF)-like protein